MQTQPSGRRPYGSVILPLLSLRVESSQCRAATVQSCSPHRRQQAPYTVRLTSREKSLEVAHRGESLCPAVLVHISSGLRVSTALAQVTCKQQGMGVPVLRMCLLIT